MELANQDLMKQLLVAHDENKGFYEKVEEVRRATYGMSDLNSQLYNKINEIIQSFKIKTPILLHTDNDGEKYYANGRGLRLQRRYQSDGGRTVELGTDRFVKHFSENMLDNLYLQLSKLHKSRLLPLMRIKHKFKPPKNLDSNGDIVLIEKIDLLICLYGEFKYHTFENITLPRLDADGYEAEIGNLQLMQLRPLIEDDINNFNENEEHKKEDVRTLIKDVEAAYPLMFMFTQ